MVQLPSLAAEENAPLHTAVRRLLWLCGAAAEASEELAALAALVPPTMPLKQILHAVELSRLPEPLTVGAEGATTEGAAAEGAVAEGAAAEGAAAEGAAAEGEAVGGGAATAAAGPARGAQATREAKEEEEAETAEEELSDELVTAALPYRPLLLGSLHIHSPTHKLTCSRIHSHSLILLTYLLYNMRIY